MSISAASASAVPGAGGGSEGEVPASGAFEATGLAVGTPASTGGLVGPELDDAGGGALALTVGVGSPLPEDEAAFEVDEEALVWGAVVAEVEDGALPLLEAPLWVWLESEHPTRRIARKALVLTMRLP